jgi:hypothetical protein
MGGMNNDNNTGDTVVVVVDGVRLVRRESRGPRGGVRHIYQAESASRSWGYWYDSAREAARKSNGTDRVTR